MLPIISKENVMFDVEATDKETVLKKMVQKLNELGYLNDENLFLHDVIEREKVFPTYLDFGIGLPHGKSEGTNQAGLCIARLNHDVIWNEEEQSKVDMVILIAVKAGSDNNLHLQILAKLSRALMHEDFIKILKEGSLDSVYDALSEKLEV